MRNVKRIDLQKIDSNNIQTTAQGFLIIPAFTARTGIQHYRSDDGSVLKEMRPEAEVFSDISMRSLRTAVVTDGHPPKMINPDNVAEFMVGHTDGFVSKKTIKDSVEKFLSTSLVITHRDAIEAIKAGKAEISNGYHVDLEFIKGEHNGEKFDAVQRNIVNNHIAIVWKGRAGSKVSLKLDESDAILITKKEGNKPMKVQVHGQEFDVSDDLGKAINDGQVANDAKYEGEKKRADDAEAKAGKTDSEKVTSLEKENKELKGDKVKSDAKIDSLTSDLEKSKVEKKDSTSVSEAVAARMSIMGVGRKMLDTETLKKLDDMSDNEIKVAVIKVDSPKADEKKLKDEAYVDARFDHIKENLADVDSSKKDLGKNIVNGREDKSDDKDYKTPEQKRQESMDESSEAWKKPIGRTVEK